MQTMNMRQSVVRLVGMGAVTVGLVLSSGLAAAAPIEVGFTECGGSECVRSRITMRELARLAPTTVQLVGGPYGPRILE